MKRRETICNFLRYTFFIGLILLASLTACSGGDDEVKEATAVPTTAPTATAIAVETEENK